MKKSKNIGMIEEWNDGKRKKMEEWNDGMVEYWGNPRKNRRINIEVIVKS
jgi:hypothetical protein